MPRLTPILYRFALAVLLGLGVATVADAQPARGLDARLDRLAQGLSLSADQTSALDAIAARYSGADADLWAAAADVKAVLTDAQIDQLQEAVQARRTERPDRAERTRRGGDRTRQRAGQRRPRDGQRGDRAGRRPRPEGERPAGAARERLTDEQREAVRAVRDDVRQEAQALAEQLRAGALTDDQFVARSRALREDGARRMAAALPAEMAQRQAQMQARREAEEAARDRALDLTDAQKRQLQALRLDRVREAPEAPDMRPYLDDDGRLDREAFRDAMRERRAATREDRGDHRDAMGDVLTDDQQDLVFLHRALSMGSRGMRGPAGPGGFGGRRGR